MLAYEGKYDTIFYNWKEKKKKNESVSHQRPSGLFKTGISQHVGDKFTNKS